jgi:hypothetical protein
MTPQITAVDLLSAVWLGATVIAWTTLVPQRMSGATFGWLNLLAVAVLAVIVATSRNARPPESIAQVLHDAEHRSEGS